MESIKKNEISNIVNTSVEDARSSLDFINDLDVLNGALEIAIERDYKTLAKLLKSRIGHIEERKLKAKHPGVNFAEVKRIVGSGADYAHLMAQYYSLDNLRAALDYAQAHEANKTMIATLGREIRDRKSVV